MAKQPVDRKKKRQQQKDEVAGIHIYKDDHNRFVYYDVFSKTGYVLHDVQLYKTYSFRFIAAIVAGVLATSFNIGITISILLGVALYAIMEIKFRNFLKKQTMIPNFKRKERPPRLVTAASEDTKKILTKILLFLAASVLFVLLVLTEPDYEMYIKVLCILLSIGSFCMGIFQLYALFYKRKKAL